MFLRVIFLEKYMYYSHWNSGKGLEFEIIPLGYSFHSVINLEQEIDPEPLVFCSLLLLNQFCGVLFVFLIYKLIGFKILFTSQADCEDQERQWM